MNEALERLKKVIEYENISVSKFAKKIGVPQTTMSNMLNRGSNPSVNILNAVIDSFEEISPKWLLTGEGDMLMSNVKNRLIQYLDEKKISKSEFGRAIGVSSAFVTSMRKSIQPDKAKSIALKYPDLNIKWLLTGEGEMLKTATNHTYVPLLPILAQGGSLNDFNPSASELRTEEIISPIKNVDFAITVTGDSMYPDYPHGSKVFIKKIDEKIFLQWGEVYVLDTDNGIIIKKIHKTDDENIVLCQSINKEFADFTISIGDVRGFYKVLLVMSLK